MMSLTFLFIASLFTSCVVAGERFYGEPVVGEDTVLISGYKYSHYNKKDLDALAQNLYFEERGSNKTDIDIAQIGYVTLNRVKSNYWPDTISDVVWQKGWSSKYRKWVAQFSWTIDAIPNEMKDLNAKKRSYKIAKAVLENQIPNMVGDANHYLNRNISNASWWTKMQYRGRFGDHWFYHR